MQRRYIIRSLLDMDFYKFTMGQLVFSKYSQTIVCYVFKNRTIKVKLADYIDENELRRQLDHVRTLRWKSEELKYLGNLRKLNGQPIFSRNYLAFLAGLQLPEYELTKVDGNFILKFQGKWAEAIYWETLSLSIINELYYRSKMSSNERRCAFKQGKTRLEQKIAILKSNLGITFSEFGTRRRFSQMWQEYVVTRLSQELSSTQFIGTSNAYLAMKYSLKPIGTCAHEMFMGLSGIKHECDDSIRTSHNQVLMDWWEVYGEDLSIALTDTYGTDFFFRDMTYEQARAWRGLRQDSGDPFEFADKAIKFYQKLGIDPKTKTIVFSDGLDLDLMIQLEERFAGHINVVFGWGTNLTNDLGVDALSLVVKLMESCGFGTVKLSDNLAKAMGEVSDVQRFKNIFGYGSNYIAQCRY